MGEKLSFYYHNDEYNKVMSENVDKDNLMERERLIWGLLLCGEPEIGSASWRKLRIYLNKNNLHVNDFWMQPGEFWQQLNWTEKKKTKIIELKKKWTVEKWQEYLDKNKWQICMIGDEAYPELLKFINDWPVALFYQGETQVWNRPTLAVVGARKVSIYGRKAVNKLLDEKIRKLTIVSGMMVGVDILAHEQAMKQGAKTVAFLGYGMSLTWPREAERTRGEILDQGGLIMSEYAPWSEPRPQRFPMRNRLVAGCAWATLVIEAAEKSGSLITANLALDYGREVLAVPGEITNLNSIGCLELIKKGAALISRSEEILELILASKVNYLPNDWNAGLKSDLKQEHKIEIDRVNELSDPEQNIIYQLLGAEELSTEDISVRLQKPVNKVMMSLSLLELAGLVRQNERGEWGRE